MTRLNTTDTICEMIVKMTDGNPDAMTVCMDILERGAQIDPDAAFGALSTMLSLDVDGIYGVCIWTFYEDVCGEDLPTMLAVIRAGQLGFVDRGVLKHAIDNGGAGIDVSALAQQVKKRLPAFGISKHYSGD